MSDLPYLQGKPPKYLFDGTKLQYHQDRLQDFLDGKRIMPLHIDMGIHKSCNIKCVYCYGVKQVKSPEFIPEDDLWDLADDAKECGIKSLAIIGDGEPTMNSGLYSFVQHAKMLELDVAVATNGLLLTPLQIEILTKSLVWLRFNISAVNKYDTIMGARPNSFRKFSKVVKYAVEHKDNCTIGLQMVAIPDCFDEIIPLAKKAIEWGVDYLVVKQFSDGGEGMPIHFDMGRYKEAEDALRIAEQMSTERTRIVAKWSAIKDSIAITNNMEWSFDRCIDLPLLFQISGNGKCYPCGYFFGNDLYCYGDLTKQRLKDILRSERYWEVIKKVAETPLAQLCRGQCRHCETNRFIDRLTKLYKNKPNLRDALITMSNGIDNYTQMLMSPPEHINFI